MAPISANGRHIITRSEKRIESNCIARTMNTRNTAAAIATDVSLIASLVCISVSVSSIVTPFGSFNLLTSFVSSSLTLYISSSEQFATIFPEYLPFVFSILNGIFLYSMCATSENGMKFPSLFLKLMLFRLLIVLLMSSGSSAFASNFTSSTITSSAFFPSS